MDNLNRVNYCKVIDNGTYYYPAWMKYGMKNVNVLCDRCGKQHLRVCIGIDEIDLCLDCISDLTELKLS